MFTSLQSNMYGPSMPALGGYKLTGRNNEEGRTDQTDRVLGDNGLERVVTAMPQYPLFAALSLCLFKNQSYEGLVMRKVRETINDLSITGRFSMRLHSFKNNPSLLSNFTSKPYEDRYHKYVFDLVSLAFEVKVVVCSVPSHMALLSETMYANKFKRCVRLLDLGDGSYEALFPRGTFEKDKVEIGSVEAVDYFYIEHSGAV